MIIIQSSNSAPLTSLVGGDSHGHSLLWPWALRWNTVHCPHLKGVVGVSLQLVDGHPGSLQAQLLGAEVNAIPAGLAAAAVRPTAFAHNIVRQILTPPWAPWGAPLQVYGGLIYVGDEMKRCWWRAYRKGGNREKNVLLAVVSGKPCIRTTILFTCDWTREQAERYCKSYTTQQWNPLVNVSKSLFTSGLGNW